VSDVFVESSAKLLDTNANDDDYLDGNKDGGSDTASTDGYEMRAGRRRYFIKSVTRLDHNLHVVHPSVRAVMQLGQTMLGGIQLIDFNNLQYVRVHVVIIVITNDNLYSDINTRVLL